MNWVLPGICSKLSLWKTKRRSPGVRRASGRTRWYSYRKQAEQQMAKRGVMSLLKSGVITEEPVPSTCRTKPGTGRWWCLSLRQAGCGVAALMVCAMLARKHMSCAPRWQRSHDVVGRRRWVSRYRGSVISSPHRRQGPLAWSRGLAWICIEPMLCLNFVQKARRSVKNG